MTEQAVFPYLLYAWLGLAVAPFVALFFFAAPYGRHARQGFGPTIGNRWGWLIMEAPAALIFAVFFFLSGAWHSLTFLVFLGLWESHYFYRAFIYPWLIKDATKRMSLAVIFSGIFFNGVNGYLNGRWLFAFSGGYPASWLLDPRFLAGTLIFFGGILLNRQSDEILLNLRAPGETGYRIPLGGWFRWVSCPNYLGEILQWAGWALAVWSLAGLSFAVWTIANLAPRAWSNHCWYREHFAEYPRERKALLPGIW